MAIPNKLGSMQLCVSTHCFHTGHISKIKRLNEIIVENRFRFIRYGWDALK